MFSYCNNNPAIFCDDAGKAVETIFDVITLGFSIAEVIANPSDPLAWVGLAGDVIDLIPFVTGVGETVRVIRTTQKIADIADGVDDTIDSYRALRKVSKGTGKEVHHIVEKRFADSLDIDNTNEMLSVALSKEQHRIYTNAWRKELPYGKTYSKREILEAATHIYADSPSLLAASIQTICK